jgi:hypothetical protein
MLALQEHGGERRTLHDLHREEGLRLRAALEQDGRAGVFDRGERPPLAAEPVLEVRHAGATRVDRLERDAPTVHRVERVLHAAHAARAELAAHDVAPGEARACRPTSGAVAGLRDREHLGDVAPPLRLRVAGRLDVGLAQRRVQASIVVISARRAAVNTRRAPPGCARGRGRRRGSDPRPSAAPPATARARRRRAAGPRGRSSRAPCRRRRRRGSRGAHPGARRPRGPTRAPAWRSRSR